MQIARGLAYSLVAVAVLCAAAVGVMSTAWFQNSLKETVKSRLEDLTGGRVEMQAMRFNPFILQVSIQGLTVRGSETSSAPPLFSAGTVVARLNLVPLARRRVRFRSLDFGKAKLHVATGSDGTTNFPGPKGSSAAERAADELIDLTVGRLTLGQTQIEWNDRQLPFELRGQDVALLMRRSSGQRYTGTLSFTAKGIGASPWSLPQVHFTSHFELSREGLNVTSLTWESPGLLGRCSLELRDLASPRGVFTLTASAQVRQLGRSLRLAEWRSGTVNLEGHGIFGNGEIRAGGRVQARDLFFEPSLVNTGPMSISADYVADRQHVELTGLSVNAAAGSAHGRAEVLFRDPSAEYHARMQIQGLDLWTALRSFLPAQSLLSKLRFASRVDGQAEAAWRGGLKDFGSQLDLVFHPFSTRSSETTPISGRARLEVYAASGLLLTVQDAQLRTPHSSLSAKGSLGSPDSKLTVEVATSDFEEWRPLIEFASGVDQPISLTPGSAASFSGAVSGTFARPEIRGKLALGPFAYRAWKWDGLAANITAGPDKVVISSGQLRSATSTLAFDGSANLKDWGLVPGAPAHLSVRARRTPIDGLKTALDLPVLPSGLVSGELDLEGAPTSLNGAGAIEVEQGAIAQEPFDSLSAKVRVSESVWYLEKIELKKGSGLLSGQMSFDSSRRSFAAELHGEQFSLAEFRRLWPGGPESPQTALLQGAAAIDIRGEGTPDDVRLNSNCTIRDFRVAGELAGDFQGQAEWTGKQVRLEGRARGPGGLVRFDGEARTEDDWPLEIKGRYENLHAAPWIHLLLKRELNASVTATGEFRLAGPLGGTGRVELESRADNLEVSFSGLTLKNEHPAELRWAADTLAVSPFKMRGPATDLEIGGTVRFAQPAALSLDAQGQADAALVSFIDPALEAHGRSEIRVRVTGSPEQPLLKGVLDVHEVNLAHKNLPVRVTGLSGKVLLEGESARVESLRGTAGGGMLTLDGSVTLGNLPRYDLRASLDQVRIPFPTDFTSGVSGKLRLVGTAGRGQLGGELNVRELSVREDIDLVSRLLEGITPFKEQAPEKTSPLASNIRLDVQVNNASALALETQSLHLLADIDLRLQGTLASPIGFGTIRFRSGDAVFRGNRYKLTRGEIRMVNTPRNQPMVDLEAETRVQRYDLTLDISGPLDNLKVTYRSDPPLPTMDILYLLALGYSKREAEMSTKTNPAAPAMEAGALLSQALSSQMSGRVQRLFGASRIKIDPSVVGPGSASGARITVEQQVTPDLTLTYSTNTASTQYRIIQFEWALNDNTSLVGVRDQNGIFGMELKFRHRFR